MKICFAGGGTLGHVIPALSIVNYLIEKSNEIKTNDLYFIASKNGVEKDIIKKYIDINNIIYLNMKGLTRKNLCINKENINLLMDINYARKELIEFYKKEKINIVFGMGGFLSYVAIKVASKMNIKCIIHEQNSTYGLANKLTISNCNLVIQSFNIKKDNSKIKTIGNPRMSEIYTKYNHISNIERADTILVVGGSRGADKINNVIIELSDFLKVNQIKCRLITGDKYFSLNQEKIINASNEYLNIIPFTNNLIYEILKHEIIISRGGATTISEIMALEKVAIYIPSPNVTGDHQRKNVENIIEDNCGEMILEKDLSAESLKNKIENLLSNEKKKQEIKENLRKIDKQNITSKIVDEIWRVYHE